MGGQGDQARQVSISLRIFDSSSSFPMKTTWLERGSFFSQSRSHISVKRLFTPWKTARRGLP